MPNPIALFEEVVYAFRYIIILMMVCAAVLTYLLATAPEDE